MMTELKCPICGNAFIPKRIDSVCCSGKCTAKLYRQLHKKTYKKICVQCGREYKAVDKRRKYCCELCAENARNKRELERYHTKKEVIESKICEQCGNEFQPKTRKARFCSKACASRYSSAFARMSVKKLVCAHCGNSFESTTAKRKYCCSECAKAAVRERNYKCGASSLPSTVSENSGRGCSKEKVNSPTSDRWAKMSLREISEECARFHLTYGQAQVMAQNGTLPEDFGLMHKEVNINETKDGENN